MIFVCIHDEVIVAPSADNQAVNGIQASAAVIVKVLFPSNEEFTLIRLSILVFNNESLVTGSFDQVSLTIVQLIFILISSLFTGIKGIIICSTCATQGILFAIELGFVVLSTVILSITKGTHAFFASRIIHKVQVRVADTFVELVIEEIRLLIVVLLSVAKF